MDAYDVIDTVGRGSFGQVAKIRRKSDGKHFVWKEMDFGMQQEARQHVTSNSNPGKMTDKEKQLIVSEVNILRSFKHPYIVRYYDRVIDRSTYKIFIIMEYCGCGDLASRIKKNKTAGVIPDERHVWRVALQLCLALEAAHTRPEGKVFHRDIKPANVFLDDDNNVKLGDFGLAKMMGESQFAHSHVGTPYYMSPEQIRDQAYDERSDIWGLGCVIYEYCTNRPPFEATNQLSLAVKIQTGRYKKVEGYSAELSNFVDLCLRVEVVMRPTVDKLLALPCLSIRLKEKKLSNHYMDLKRREQGQNDREAWLDAREAEVEKREADVRLAQQLLDHREQLLAEREAAMYAGLAAHATPAPAASTPPHRDSAPLGQREPPSRERECIATPPSRGSVASSRPAYSSEHSTPPASLPVWLTRCSFTHTHPHTELLHPVSKAAAAAPACKNKQPFEGHQQQDVQASVDGTVACSNRIDICIRST